MTDQTIRVGFVGAGANSRKHHIPKLKAQPGVELMAVANRTKESGETIAAEFGITRVYGDWRELVRAVRCPEPIRAMAERGRQLVLDRYDWDALAGKLEQVWDRCVNADAAGKGQPCRSST